MKLKESVIGGLQPTEKVQTIPVEGLPGLYLLVQPSGHKSWALVYRNKIGVQKRKTYGPWPAVMLNRAKNLALTDKGAIANGVDVVAVEKADRAAKKTAHLHKFTRWSMPISTRRRRASIGSARKSRRNAKARSTSRRRHIGD